jgi:hypothetical protein
MSAKVEARVGAGTPVSANGPTGSRSREGLHGTVPVPPAGAGFWRQYRAFVGPAFLVSVGYMDPGNWGTDFQGGAAYRYDLLWVVALSSLMAVVMQVLAEEVLAQGSAINRQGVPLPGWDRPCQGPGPLVSSCGSVPCWSDRDRHLS